MSDSWDAIVVGADTAGTPCAIEEAAAPGGSARGIADSPQQHYEDVRRA